MSISCLCIRLFPSSQHALGPLPQHVPCMHTSPGFLIPCQALPDFSAPLCHLKQLPRLPRISSAPPPILSDPLTSGFLRSAASHCSCQGHQEPLVAKFHGHFSDLPASLSAMQQFLHPDELAHLTLRLSHCLVLFPPRGELRLGPRGRPSLRPDCCWRASGLCLGLLFSYLHSLLKCDSGSRDSEWPPSADDS